jgi:hypothetical protein
MKWGVPQPLRRVVDVCVELFQWWRGEMRDIGQALLRQLPSRKSPELLLRIGAASATLERRAEGAWQVIGTIPAREDGSWPAELPGLATEQRGARTALVFENGEFYFDDIELPLATERHLAPVVRLQLERRLPVPLEQLLTDYQIIARDKRTETLRVRAAVAHRELVEAWRERAAGWGLSPVSAGAAGAGGGLEFNLLKRRRDPLRWTPSPLDLRLMRIAAVGVCACLAVVGAQWIRERSVVNRATAELHARAQKLTAQRTALTTRAAPLLALRQMVAAPSSPELLAQLSAAVPGSAWFNHIDLATPAEGVGAVKLMGTVGSQEEVVATLRTVPGIHDLRTSSAFSGEILGRDRVEFSAEYQPRKGTL